MGLRTKGKASDFEICPEGNKMARCFKIVDLGTHAIPAFDNKETHQVRIFFELPKTLMKEGELAGQPFIVSAQYTLSHHPKANLRLDIESWYGKRFDTKALNDAGGFDLEKLLGRPAYVNIIHSADGEYANIGAITPLPEGMECPPQVYPSFVFSFDDFNATSFAKLSPKMQEFIKKSGEWIRMHAPRDERRPPVTDGGLSTMEDDIPFMNPYRGAVLYVV